MVPPVQIGLRRAWKALAAALPIAVFLTASPASLAAVVDHEVRPRRPGDKFDLALFRLWLPDGVKTLRGLFVMGGPQGNPFEAADAARWQQLAGRHQFGIVGLFVREKPEAGRLAGATREDAMLEALSELAKKGGHPEVERVPLFVKASDMGYELASGKPQTADSILGLILANPNYNKLPEASARARKIPLLAVLPEWAGPVVRADATRFIEENRKKGALWGLASRIPDATYAERARLTPAATLEEVRAREFEMISAFAEGLIAQRLPASPGPMKTAEENKGWIGESDTAQVGAALTFAKARTRTVWLPDEKSARVWQKYVATAAPASTLAATKPSTPAASPRPVPASPFAATPKPFGSPLPAAPTPGALAMAKAVPRTASLPPAAPVAAAPNTLSDQQRAGGWRLLFDGKSTEGWRNFKQPDISPGWTVIDGALVTSPGAGHAITKDQFGNFELEVEWKTDAGGDSGILYRVSEEAGSPHATGPQYQIRQDASAVGANISGACASLFPANKLVSKPSGEWNQTRIIADGTHIEHWLNGEQVVSFEIDSPEWKAKVSGKPLLARLPRGHLCLEAWSGKVAFRNFKILPIPEVK